MAPITATTSVIVLKRHVPDSIHDGALRSYSIRQNAAEKLLSPVFRLLAHRIKVYKPTRSPCTAT